MSAWVIQLFTRFQTPLLTNDHSFSIFGGKEKTKNIHSALLTAVRKITVKLEFYVRILCKCAVYRESQHGQDAAYQICGNNMKKSVFTSTCISCFLSLNLQFAEDIDCNKIK